MSFTVEQQSMHQESIPPRAPSVEEPIHIIPHEHPTTGNVFTPGEFDYILPDWDRSYIKDAYQVISRNEWWRPFREALQTRGVDNQTGFMFSRDLFYNQIMNAISETSIGGGHSGCSMGFVMRAMETIALYGEADYRRQCLEYQATRNQRRQLQQQQAY